MATLRVPRDLARKALNIADLRRLSRRRLPRGLFDFVDRGSEDEVSLRANRAQLDAVQFLPKMGIDVSGRCINTQLCGRAVSAPIVIAPTGMAAMLWPDGEFALASACAQFGVPYCNGTHALTSLERLATIPGLDLWLQLYILLDRTRMDALIAKAKSCGVRTMVVTLDANISPNREYNQRSGFLPPLRPTWRNMIDVATHPRWALSTAMPWITTPPRFANLSDDLSENLTHLSGVLPCRIDPSASWGRIKELREIWHGDLLIKGVLRADDAARALECGATGIIVSNHGGRSLDGAISAIAALAKMAPALSKEMTVIFDSGITRGADIARALAIRADAVMIGRSTMWGIGAAGAEGALHALNLLASEFDRVLGLLGVNSPEELRPDLVQYGMPGNI